MSINAWPRFSQPSAGGVAAVASYARPLLRGEEPVRLTETAPMPLLRALILVLALAPAAGLAGNCEAIRAQIDAKIKASGHAA